MSQSRLTTAVEEGRLALPEGPVAVLRPPPGADLSVLPREAVRIVTTFRPDFDHWQAAGYAVSDRIEPASAAVVFVPRSKALARALVSEAAGAAPLIAVDGQRTDGVDSLFRELRQRIGDLPSLAKGHGRLFWFTRTETFADWAAPEPAPGPERFVTRAGVFSEAGPDRGSVLLAGALPARLPRRMADLGAGWGYLAAAVLARDGVEQLDLVEAERLSLDCARINITDPRARFLWADATTHRPEAPYDGIVMNPPFHTGRTPDPALGQAFIAAAARQLSSSGQLWMVANRHLPYEAALRAAFRTVTEIGGDSAFKLFHATRPQRPGRV